MSKEDVELEMEIPLNLKTGDNKLGFKQEWISANHEGIEMTLYSGAGCGNSNLDLVFKRKGKNFYFQVDMQDFCQTAFAKFREMMESTDRQGQPK